MEYSLYDDELYEMYGELSLLCSVPSLPGSGGHMKTDEPARKVFLGSKWRGQDSEEASAIKTEITDNGLADKGGRSRAVSDTPEAGNSMLGRLSSLMLCVL